MNKYAHYLAVFGATLQVLIPIGFVVSQLRLNSAVSGMDLGSSADIQQIVLGLRTTTSEMGSAFDFFLWTLGFAMLALVLFIIAVARFRYRHHWAFWFSCIYGACLTCLAPLGTPFGLFLLIYALTHRQEFVPSTSASAISPA